MRSRKAANRASLLLDDTLLVESSGGGDLPVDHSLDAEGLEPWFEMTVADRRVAFAFAPPATLERHNDGQPCWALTLIERGLVLFEVGLKKRPAELRTTLLHELVHVALNAPIASGPLLASIFGTRTTKQADDREEQLASYLSNNLAGALFASKLMRLPRVPR